MEQDFSITFCRETILHLLTRVYIHGDVQKITEPTELLLILAQFHFYRNFRRVKKSVRIRPDSFVAPVMASQNSTAEDKTKRTSPDRPYVYDSP